jgi:hypothetical protein
MVVAATAVRVAIRVRGLSPNEHLRGCVACVHVPPGPPVCQIGDARVFPVDHAWGPQTDQAQVYADAVAPLLERAFNGFNVTVLAYGVPHTHNNELDKAWLSTWPWQLHPTPIDPAVVEANLVVHKQADSIINFL